jgi:ABC-type transporter Mla MlaB component
LLRITKIFESAESVTLKVEGLIVTEWVTVLERESKAWLQEKRAVQLDFSEVRFIDSHGVEMLKRITSEKLRRLNCPPFIEEILKGIGEYYE